MRFSDSESALHPGICLGWAHWVFHAMSFRDSLSRGWGGVSFAFVPGFVAKSQGPSSLAPQFADFTVPARPTRDNRNGRLLYPVQVVRCYLFRLGCALSAMRAVPFCRRVLHEGVIEDHCLLLAPDAVVMGVSALGHGTVCFVSLELGALVLSLRVFFEKNFAVILVEGRGCGSRAHPCEAAT